MSFNKRPGFKYKEPVRTKFPKLDISIVGSQQNKFGSSWHNNNLINSRAADENNKKHQPQQHHQQFGQQSENMWGDDEDDDLIMLASQMVDNVNTLGEKVLVDSMSETIIEKRPDRKQQPGTSSSAAAVAANQISYEINDFLNANEDEDLFSEVTNYDNALVAMNHIGGYPKNGNPSILTVPQSTQLPVVAPSKFFAPTTTSTQVIITTDRGKNNRNSADYFLSKKNEEIQKEKEHLQQQIAKMNDKFQTKEGESSMLRYELQQSKKLNCELAREKKMECHRIKQESLAKVAELEKQLKTMQAEIDFKNVEINNIKTKKCNSSATLNSNKPIIENDLSKNEICKMFQLNLLIPDLTVNSDNAPDCTAKALITRCFNDNILNAEIIQSLKNAAFQFKAGCPIDEQSLVLKTFNDLSVYICELKTYLSTLKIVDSNSTIEYNYAQGLAVKNGLVYSDDIYRIPCRVIDLSFLCCLYSERFSKQLLTQYIGCSDIEKNKTILEVLTEILMTIGLSKELIKYEKFIESSCSLLEIIADVYDGSDKSDQILIDLLRSLIFCRPNRTGIQEITKFLCKISGDTKPPTNVLLNKLCSKNNENYIAINESYDILHFTAKTCSMQLFATMLRILYSSNDSLNKTNAEHLTKLTIQLLNLIRNCFCKSIDWMTEHTAAPIGNVPATMCLCYGHIICAAIYLVHYCIELWHDKPVEIDTTTTKTIVQMTVFLIYDHFVKHYDEKVLMIGRTSIRNRLQIVYDWIKDNRNHFEFSKSHEKALAAIDLRRLRLMIDPLKCAPAKKNKSNEQLMMSWQLEIFENFFENR